MNDKSKPDAQKRVCASEMGCGIIATMNIEYTGRYDAAAAKRFAGKVYDRVARGMLVSIYVLLAVCAVVEVLQLVNGGRFSYCLLAAAVVILCSIKAQRARYQKAIDVLNRRYFSDSEEATVVMTDDFYECRCGANQMRVAWPKLAAYYLFVDDGVVLMMDGKLTTLLIRSLPEMGVQAGELKDTLERAGLKDYRTRCNRSWLVAPIAFCIIGAIFILGLARRRPQISACVSCVDETPAGERAVPAWNHCDFAARLYCAAAPKAPEENFVVSPCGVASGLALMGAGSGGDTAKGFRRALSMHEEGDCDEKGTHDGFHDVAAFQAWALYDASDGQSHVETDSALWLAPDVKMDRRFEGAAEFFGAEKLKGDAKKAIAGFVAEKTRGTGLGSAIPEVDPLARMIAVNAVRFSGVWQRPFRRIETYARPFKAPGGEVSVPFMHSLMTAELCECDGAKALRLPYKNGKFEMVFVLPPEDQSLAWLEGRLDSDFFGRLLASARMMDDVDVALPKFEIECSLSLKGALAAMGLEKAFADGADFSAIAREPLFLSDVEQSAVLRVDEAGTEAAAATKVTALCAAAGMISFEACRPFLFVLREKAHGVVVFIGRVATPRPRHGA